MQNIDKVIEYLRKQYELALTLEYVRKPLAWALYQTWRYYDRKERERK